MPGNIPSLKSNAVPAPHHSGAPSSCAASGAAPSTAARAVTSAASRVLALTRRAQAVFVWGQWRLRWDRTPDECVMPGETTARLHAQAPTMFALLMDSLAEHDEISQRINGRGELCICGTCDKAREILASVAQEAEDAEDRRID